MSSTKAPCVIWAAKGCEEIHRRKTRVRSREYVGTLLSVQRIAVNQGGTADICIYSSLTEFVYFCQGRFCLSSFGSKYKMPKGGFLYVYTFKTMARAKTRIVFL